MNAADRLPPQMLESAALWSALMPLTPDAVRVRPAPRWMWKVTRGRVAAMTLGSTVFVDRRFLTDGGDQVLGRLLAHELMHARQWQRLGVAAFLVSYLGDYLRARMRGLGHDASYRQIRLEVEASRFAATLM